jgi:hypothetical protein
MYNADATTTVAEGGWGGGNATVAEGGGGVFGEHTFFECVLGVFFLSWQRRRCESSFWKSVRKLFVVRMWRKCNPPSFFWARQFED